MSRSRSFPLGFILPCLLTNGRTVPAGLEWVHEIKHDGYRMICRRDGTRLRIFSRRGLDWTGRMPRIAAALQALCVSSATIDGEAVVRDQDGVTDFDRLRKDLARTNARSQDVFLYAFDLLERDLRRSWQARASAPELLRKGARFRSRSLPGRRMPL